MTGNFITMQNKAMEIQQKVKVGKTGNKTSFCITKEEKEEGRLHISTSLEGLVNDTLLEDD